MIKRIFIWVFPPVLLITGWIARSLSFDTIAAQSEQSAEAENLVSETEPLPEAADIWVNLKQAKLFKGQSTAQVVPINREPENGIITPQDAGFTYELVGITQEKGQHLVHFRSAESAQKISVRFRGQIDDWQLTRISKTSIQLTRESETIQLTLFHSAEPK